MVRPSALPEMSDDEARQASAQRARTRAVHGTSILVEPEALLRDWLTTTH